MSDTASISFAPTTGARSTTSLSDALVMTGRSLRLGRRNTDAVVMGLLLPVMLLLVFVYLFGGAIHSGIDYVDFVVPGVLLIAVSIGTAATAVSVNSDMTEGIIDRFRSMDISGGAVLSGHVVASMVRNAVSVLLVLAVALAIGFRPQAGAADWVAAAAVLLLFVMAFSWLAAMVGLLTTSAEGANGFTFFALFLTYPSSALVPIHTMPGWIQGFAQHQPVTPVIDSVRDLLLRTPTGSAPWVAAAWCVGILIVALVMSGVLFQRRSA
jgi:ABC-2 type transport system permease protein